MSITVHAPGRINIIGEHTDYNNGLVLPAAISQGITFELTRNATKQTARFSTGALKEQYAFQLDNFERLENGWPNYVMGVVHELQLLGAKLEGFDARFSGDVPIGSGMSSSAALECSLAYGLNQLFELELDEWQLIKVCQMAEHNFVGTKCGIMDQFASIMGKKDQVMMLDCGSLDYEYFPCVLGNYELVLLNTNVSHSLADSSYNRRREECKEGLSILQESQNNISSLSDVLLSQLLSNKDKMTDTIYNRCLHVISENIRVSKATEALKSKNFEMLGTLMYSSHFSLQNHYEVSCTELDALVSATKSMPYVLGSRMMGGGFGGCTINLVANARVDDFIKKSTKVYQNTFGKEPTPYYVNIGDGARVIM